MDAPLREYAQPFYLDREIPVRIRVLSQGMREHGLLFVFHHIALDKASIPLFLKQLFALYHGEMLTPLDASASFAGYAWEQWYITTQAKEYYKHATSLFQETVAIPQRFWYQQVMHALTLPRLLRTSWEEGVAVEELCRLDGEMTASIRAFCQACAITLPNFFIIAFLCFLHNVFALDEIA